MSKKVTVIVEGREYIVEVGDLRETPIRATVNQRMYKVDVPSADKQRVVPTAPAMKQKPAAPQVSTPSGAAITAPMPGDILELCVKVGDTVEAGMEICVLEAMKMKNMIRTPRAGVIASIEVTVGQAVDYGAVLVSFA